MSCDMRQTAHRPYPMARGPWAMAMVWHELLFMHWPVDAAVLRPLVPAGLEIDTYTGNGFVDQAFIGVVPFRMSGVRARGTPAAPGLSAFPELNVRTYVRSAPTADEPRGRPGVWFFSLDAANRLAVEVARATFHLNYLRARMVCERENGEAGWVRYVCERRDGRATAAAFRGRYRGVGPVCAAGAGSLEAFLTERYCLYAADRRGRALRGEIHHAPWPLRSAEAAVEVNTMAEAAGIGVEDVEGRWPLLHYVERLEVAAWLPRRVMGVSPGARGSVGEV